MKGLKLSYNAYQTEILGQTSQPIKSYLATGIQATGFTISRQEILENFELHERNLFLLRFLKKNGKAKVL